MNLAQIPTTDYPERLKESYCGRGPTILAERSMQTFDGVV
jgi:hypothetical protein